MNDPGCGKAPILVWLALLFLIAGGCIPLDDGGDDTSAGAGGEAVGADVAGAYSLTFNTEAGGRSLDTYLIAQQGATLRMQAFCVNADPLVHCASLDGARGAASPGPDPGRIPFSMVNDTVTITGEFFRQEGMLSLSAQVVGTEPVNSGQLRGVRQEAPLIPKPEEEPAEEEEEEEEEKE